MNQQPDNFFQEKLKHYQKPVPTAAWNKIEVGIQKKTDPRIWLKFAASVLLLVGIGYALWVSNSKPSTQPLTQIKASQPVLPEKNIKKVDSAILVLPPIVKDQSIESKRMAESRTTTTKAILQRKKFVPSPAASGEVDQEKNADGGNAIPETSPAEDLSPASSHNVATSKKTSTITLTFTAEETDKYLNKNALAEATQDQKKSSTFKKLLQKANDLKSNQDPFGDLREKKNEILALNFKNEKRGQNK
jgi:hypothetical protein